MIIITECPYCRHEGDYQDANDPRICPTCLPSVRAVICALAMDRDKQSCNPDIDPSAWIYEG